MDTKPNQWFGAGNCCIHPLHVLPSWSPLQTALAFTTAENQPNKQSYPSWPLTVAPHRIKPRLCFAKHICNLLLNILQQQQQRWERWR